LPVLPKRVRPFLSVCRSVGVSRNCTISEDQDGKKTKTVKTAKRTWG